MLSDHEEPHGHHVVILPLVVGAGSISLLPEHDQGLPLLINEVTI